MQTKYVCLLFWYITTQIFLYSYRHCALYFTLNVRKKIYQISKITNPVRCQNVPDLWRNRILFLLCSGYFCSCVPDTFALVFRILFLLCSGYFFSCVPDTFALVFRILFLLCSGYFCSRVPDTFALVFRILLLSCKMGLKNISYVVQFSNFLYL